MQIINPLQLNDWEFKKFLIFILSLQLALWGTIYLDALGLHIPILRQLIGFIYLTFVPGILILRILNLHKLGKINSLLYAIGLSLTTLMFTGFFINAIFPLLGISHPMSVWPLVFSIGIVVLILSICAYIRDRSFSSLAQINLHDILSPPVLILSLIPFGMIGGTYLVNFYSNNLLLVILLLIIALIPLVIAFTKFIPEKFFPYAVFCMAIGLLYHLSLISMYLWGWDIHLEYYITNLVIQNAFWDSTIYSTLNSMLSLVILGPIYSLTLDMGLDWVFKIIYPFLFAFVPLGLYELIKKQTDGKIAFFSCFFFISLFTFYTEMLSLARQEIAELFLVLIIFSMIDKNLNKFQKSAFFLVFSASLIVSHYGLSYLFMLMLLLAWAISTVGYRISFQKYIYQFFTWFQEKTGSYDEINLQKHLFESNLFPFTFVLYYSIFLLIWNIYTAGASSFELIMRIFDNITTNMYSEFLNPQAAQGIAIMTTEAVSQLHEVSRYLHLITLFFIVIGFISSVVRCIKVQFDIRYLLLSFGALVICVGGVALPYFASALNTSRIYQISLILLAPFCVLGGITVIRVISRFINVSWRDNQAKISLRILSVFFVLFFLFNSGWIYEMVKDNPGSIALSQESNKNSTSINDKLLLYDMLNVLEQDVFSARWFDRNVKEGTNIKVYVDYVASHPLRSYGMVPLINQQPLSNTTSKIEPGDFVFLGYPNIVENIARESDYPFYTSDLNPFLRKINKIYSNGGSEIYNTE
jgi:uncharacterized membrane protein